MTNDGSADGLLASLVLSPSPEESAQQVAEATIAAVGCDSAAVMVLYPTRTVETVATTDSVVERCDTAQLDLNEGPCLDAITDTALVSAPTVGHDPRWPRWGPMVAAHGFNSVLSVRLFTSRSVVGALNLYSRNPRNFDPDAEAEALLMAYRAAAAIAVAQRHEDLNRAIAARHHIGLAQGVLMAQHGLDAQTAFDVLYRYSQDSNRRLRDIASEVVHSRQLPGRPDGGA
jgi:GAF domain-containing protein